MTNDPTVDTFEVRTDDQIVPAGGVVTHATRDHGKFAKGNPGRPKGAVNKAGQKFAELAAEEIFRLTEEEKIPANPIMATVFVLRKAYERYQESSERADLHIMLAAARELNAVYVPQKFSLSVEQPEPADEERVQKTKRMLATLWIEQTEIVDDRSARAS